jgi:hypothetical protein
MFCSLFAITQKCPKMPKMPEVCLETPEPYLHPRKPKQRLLGGILCVLALCGEWNLIAKSKTAESTVF